LLRTVTAPSVVSGTAAALRRNRPIAAVTLAMLAFYLVDSLSRYPRFLANGYDLGIFDQVVRAYSRFHVPTSALKGHDYNIFGDHFHPILALLAPLYWIWDNPCTLLIAQAFVVAASIPVVYRFTRRRASESVSILVAIGYGLGWPVLSLIDFDFHEIAFASLLLALAIDAFDRRADAQLLVFSGLLLFVREDMGVLVAMLGLFVLCRGGVQQLWRRRARVSWRGVAMVVVGVAAFEVTTGVILPAFAPNHQYAYWQYDALGKDLPDVIKGMITRPWHAVAVFFTPVLKSQTLAYLFLPVALVPLRSPYVLLSLPIFAERFFNSREYLWSPHWQYNALPWLILVLAAVDGAARLGWFRATRPAAIGRSVLLGCLLASPVLVALLSDGTTAQPQNPFHRLTGAAWHTTDRMRAQSAAVAAVPSGVCVEADDRVVTHLTARNYASLPGMQHGTADFVVLDLSEENVGNFGPAPATIERQARDAGYVEVFSQGSMIVLRSPHYAGPSPQCRPLGGGR
jgi:uncharacterized membrane protein